MFWLGQCRVWSCKRAAQVMSILKAWVLKCACVLCPYIPRELVMVEGGVDEVKQSEPCFQHAGDTAAPACWAVRAVPDVDEFAPSQSGQGVLREIATPKPSFQRVAAPGTVMMCCPNSRQSIVFLSRLCFSNVYDISSEKRNITL